MKLKKVCGLWMGTIMLASMVLTGCGSGKDQTQGSSAAEGESQEQTQGTDGGEAQGGSGGEAPIR